jgi:hypothetical protein
MPHQAGRVVIDVRCTSAQPGSHRPGDIVRCQLLAGHESAHAVMFCRGGRRMVRTWRRSDAATICEHWAGQDNLPWAIGMPRPAWGESAEGRRFPSARSG